LGFLAYWLVISVFGWAFLDPQFSIFGFGRFLSKVFLGQHWSRDSALSENQMGSGVKWLSLSVD